jgi:hypothetical protein
MSRKSVAVAVAVLGLLVLPTFSHAQFKQADWDLTLSGTGSNDKDFETFNASATASIGYFVADQLELGLRPSATIGDGGSQHLYNVGAFADFHFDIGKLVPFVGGNIGYQFGSEIAEDGWSAGPEAGLKFFLNNTTYVFGIASYQFNLNEGFDSGAFVYGLGLGVKL